jgi:glutathione S-transferase
MRLFHIPGSRSTRVLWMLEELGVPYQLELINGEEKRSESHRERHPLGRVPVLELDDGRYVFESAAICMHLADLHPDGGLFPSVGSTERALGYQWTVFAMSELEPAAFGVLRARRASQDDSEPAARLLAVQEALDAALQDRAWLLGDTFSVPDIFVASILGTVVRRELSDPGETLRSYVRRAQDRPANVRAEAIRPAPSE